MRRSLMNCQMMRVISSPSSSTTLPSTLILSTTDVLLCRCPPAVFGPSTSLARSRDILTSRYLGVRRLLGLACHHGGPHPAGADGSDRRRGERPHLEARPGGLPRA